jgi:hypothetical protein
MSGRLPAQSKAAAVYVYRTAVGASDLAAWSNGYEEDPGFYDRSGQVVKYRKKALR